MKPMPYLVALSEPSYVDSVKRIAICPTETRFLSTLLHSDFFLPDRRVHFEEVVLIFMAHRKARALDILDPVPSAILRVIGK